MRPAQPVLSEPLISDSNHTVNLFSVIQTIDQGLVHGASPVGAVRTTHFRLKPYGIFAWCDSNHRLGLKSHGKSSWCYPNHSFQTNHMVYLLGVIQTIDQGLNHMINPVGVIQTAHFRLKPYGIFAWCNPNHRLGLKSHGKSSWCYRNHSFQTQIIWYM